jgi:hypothetical protein
MFWQQIIVTLIDRLTADEFPLPVRLPSIQAVFVIVIIIMLACLDGLRRTRQSTGGGHWDTICILTASYRVDAVNFLSPYLSGFITAVQLNPAFTG